MPAGDTPSRIEHGKIPRQRRLAHMRSRERGGLELHDGQHWRCCARQAGSTGRYPTRRCQRRPGPAGSWPRRQMGPRSITADTEQGGGRRQHRRSHDRGGRAYRQPGGNDALIGYSRPSPRPYVPRRGTTSRGDRHVEGTPVTCESRRIMCSEGSYLELNQVRHPRTGSDRGHSPAHCGDSEPVANLVDR